MPWNTVIASIVALLLGAAIATGVWIATDSDTNILPAPATEVIVTAPSTGAVKNEAATAASISASVPDEVVVVTEQKDVQKDEAAIAASLSR